MFYLLQTINILQYPLIHPFTMVVPSNKTLLLLTLSLFSFATAEAQDDPFYLSQDCSSEKTNDNTSFQFKVKNLLSDLSSNAIGNTNIRFYNTTITGENPSDSIYGLFMCRGDVSSQLCQQCVQNATLKLSSECSLSKQSLIWYEECMVWYSTALIFSTMATKPGFTMQNSGNVSNPLSFMPLVFLTLNKTADEASLSTTDNNKFFATRERNVSGSQTLYCLAQCTPNLSPLDCRTCLGDAIGELPGCCEGRIGGRVLFPSCNIRYELYPFYDIPSPTPTPKLVPETKASHADSLFSEDYPIYLSHNCSNKTFLTANNTFQTHLTTLLSTLASNATSGKKFYKANVDDTVFGLFLCRDRDNIPSSLCGECVQNATHQISSKCPMFSEAIIWYSQCMLRYSYRNFFNKVEKSPVFSELNSTNKGEEQNFFTVKLAKTLDQAAIQAGDSDERCGTKTTKLNDLQTLYTLAQCTRDLSIEDCKGCLGIVIGTSIPWSRLGSIGGRVLYPSCNVRFELFQFYKDIDKTGTPWPERRKGPSRIIILIVVLASISVTLFFAAYYFLRKKARKSHATVLKENFGREIATLDSLQFDLATVKAATNNFSDQNKIGKGGFGEVYKGILLDGSQVAIKRLSKSSKQGANEFKNEVLLIAKLQHRNLVTLKGFCLDEQEKILIYEYVTNMSLDYFLFDSRLQKSLSWFERYNIIGGIAQGILYLHEHSRWKVIHRDLKPSNILLDEHMIPKISDFGLARIVEISEDQGSTNIIVGT
ncbi:cysteine-rich receptor-like protein kinase 25 isoform X2 [Cajanus cajan]|nr:cysteine-rich receptor-like protein kinase 25 isoform X2 [Cajanus cajan]